LHRNWEVAGEAREASVVVVAAVWVSSVEVAAAVVIILC
jgi:hypothetical protein